MVRTSVFRIQQRGTHCGVYNLQTLHWETSKYYLGTCGKPTELVSCAEACAARADCRYISYTKNANENKQFGEMFSACEVRSKTKKRDVWKVLHMYNIQASHTCSDAKYWLGSCGQDVSLEKCAQVCESRPGCMWIAWNKNGCDEMMHGTKGSEYKGCQTRTRSGRTCMNWSLQSPHKHGYRHDNDNYCRNPSASTTGIWCYTTDPQKRWENCDALPSHAAYRIERDYDYPGDDLSSKTSIPSAEECAQLCGGTKGCRSFSFQKSAQKCFLKKSVKPGRKKDTCCDAGLPAPSKGMWFFSGGS